MAAIGTETVTQVHHWNESLFSFRTTRDPGFRFENGHFVMLGLEVAGRPLMRAYSIASPNWEEHLEFFSIKVPDGPLTSRLQHLQVGDTVLVSRKPTGTLVIHDLKAGRHLYLLSSGTGLAPFMSVIQDPETYERFETVVVTHGVRQVSDLAYRQFITETLPALMICQGLFCAFILKGTKGTDKAPQVKTGPFSPMGDGAAQYPVGAPSAEGRLKAHTRRTKTRQSRAVWHPTPAQPVKPRDYWISARRPRGIYHPRRSSTLRSPDFSP